MIDVYVNVNIGVNQPVCLRLPSFAYVRLNLEISLP